MPSYTLHAPAGSFRAFSALIAAEYNGIDVTVADFDAGSVAAVSPSGKAPVLVLPNGSTLFSSHAIARFIAGIRRDTGLVGGSLLDAAQVDSWMDFAAQELELPACVWFYPVSFLSLSSSRPVVMECNDPLGIYIICIYKCCS